MTQTVSQTGSGSTAPVNPRLLELLGSGEFDWDNPRHREAYLRAWVKGELPGKTEDDRDRSASRARPLGRQAGDSGTAP